MVHGLAEEGLTFATVVDVGANVGKFSRAAIGVWPDIDVIAFEALPDVASQIKVPPRRVGTIEVHAIALGARDGTIEFHPHEYSLSSSPLPVPANVQATYSWARELSPITVPVRRLDGVLEDRVLRTPVLLKLDVQGFELQVLAGGAKTLESASAILIEQAFDQVYEGQPLFGESHAFLEAAGWRLARLMDWRREGGRIAEVDCLYVRVEGPRP
jgi:FkbM family methyltransferase